MVDIIIVSIYLVVMLFVGYYYGIRMKTVTEYAVAEKKYPTPIIMATVFATLIGGASTIGVAQQFFSVGIVFYIVCLGAVFRDLITAKWVIPKIGDISGLISPGDIMKRHYGRPGQVITRLAGLTLCIGVIGAQITALGFLGNYFLNIPYNISAIVAGGVLIIYSSYGGIKSVTVTDVIQLGILLVAIPMVCNFGLSTAGGLGVLFDKVPESHLTFLVDPAIIIKYVGLGLVFMLPDLDPAILQRILMSRNLRQAQLSLVVTSLSSIPLYAIAGLIGLIALTIMPNLEPKLAFPFLLNNVLPIGIKGFTVAGIFAVVMSTADSYLNIGGISLVHDVINPLKKTPMDDKKELKLMQFASLILGILSAIYAMILPDVFSLVVASLSIWEPVIFPAMFIAMLGLVWSQKLFYIGIASSLITLLVWNATLKTSFGIDGILIASLVHFVVLLSPYLLFHKRFLGLKKQRVAV